MKATLELELIGDDSNQRFKFYSDLVDDGFGTDGIGEALFGRPPIYVWVAEIIGPHPKYRYGRRFLRGKKDYSHSNSTGSRGVCAWYILESGKYYDVSERVSWKRVDRYFIRVNNSGDIVRVEDEEVEKWAKNL